MIPVADALSRVTPMDPEDNIKLPIIAVNMITAHVLMCAESPKSLSNSLDRIRKGTLQDDQLNRLSRYIAEGFPSDKHNLLEDLQQFWDYRDLLSIKSGLITQGNRIIVPKEMKEEMLQYIYKGHQGKGHCLIRAKDTVFWPKITLDVQRMIEKCTICLGYVKSQPITGSTSEIPPFPLLQTYSIGKGWIFCSLQMSSQSTF